MKGNKSLNSIGGQIYAKMANNKEAIKYPPHRFKFLMILFFIGRDVIFSVFGMTNQM